MRWAELELRLGEEETYVTYSEVRRSVSNDPEGTARELVRIPPDAKVTGILKDISLRGYQIIYRR